MCIPPPSRRHPAAHGRQPETDRFVLSGVGLSDAAAGEDSVVRVLVHDRFGNTAQPSAQTRFGMVLVASERGAAAGKGLTTSNRPGGGQGKAADFGKGAEGKGNKGKHDAQAQFKGESMPFDGKWIAATDSYELRYRPLEAGSFDLHIWSEQSQAQPQSLPLEARAEAESQHSQAQAVSEGRSVLPGSPFAVQVKMGSPSASGSQVSGSDATPELGDTPTAAGERLVVRAQVKDAFGNAAVAAEG